MQRRAAAIYFVFFLAIAVGAWAYIGVAEQAHEPEFSVSGTTVEAGATTTIDGVEYAVGEIEGEGEDTETTLSWSNQSAVQTATLEHNTTIDYRGGEYGVVVPNETEPSSFTLQEQLNVSALLAEDDTVENEIAEQNGTQYVVYAENQSLYPLADWLPEPEVDEFAQGDQIEYDNATTTVDSITSTGATLRWEAPADEETDLTEGGNVTLANGQQYFTHFPSGNEVILAPSSEYDGYSQTVAERDYFGERLAGLWGVMIIAAVAALLLLSVAYLPSRG